MPMQIDMSMHGCFLLMSGFSHWARVYRVAIENHHGIREGKQVVFFNRIPPHPKLLVVTIHCTPVFMKYCLAIHEVDCVDHRHLLNFVKIIFWVLSTKNEACLSAYG